MREVALHLPFHVPMVLRVWLRLAVLAVPLILLLAGCDRIFPGPRVTLGIDNEALGRDMAGALARDVRERLRDAGFRYRSVQSARDGSASVVVDFGVAASAGDARAMLRTAYPAFEPADAADGTFQLRITEPAIERAGIAAMPALLEAVRARAKELGGYFASVEQAGPDELLVSLPGNVETGAAVSTLSTRMVFQLHLVDTRIDARNVDTRRVPRNRILRQTRDGERVVLHAGPIVTDEYIEDASSGATQAGNPSVYLSFDDDGGARMESGTRAAVGKPMAVLVASPDESGNWRAAVLMIAVIRDTLGKRIQVTGFDSIEEARTVALLLRAGRLPAPVSVVAIGQP